MVHKTPPEQLYQDPTDALLKELLQHPLVERRDTLLSTLATVKLTSADDPTIQSPDVRKIDMLVSRRGCTKFAWTPGQSDSLPVYMARVLAEVMTGDLALYWPEFQDMDPVIYRRDVSSRRTAEVPESWHPISSLAVEYGGKTKDVLSGTDDWIRDALLYMHRFIRRAMRFICTDGEIQYEYRGEKGGWLHGVRENGVETQDDFGLILDPGMDDAIDKQLRTGPSGAQLRPMDMDRPCMYTVRTGCTVAEAKALAHRVGGIFKAWTATPNKRDHEKPGTMDVKSAYNLMLVFAAPFMRSHPEKAYVMMGPGGTGKSTLLKNYMKHLGDNRAMMFSFDLLTQPTAMSAENTMLNLTNHLVACTDDFTPGRQWQDQLSPFKTLTTGMLPFAARRRGEDSIESLRPQAVHVITSNEQLPLGENKAEQRRFAISVLRNKYTLEYYNRLVNDEGTGVGFWPVMLCSADAWALKRGKHAEGGTYVNAENLSDDQVAAIRAVIKNGYVRPERGVRINWRSIGLVRSSRRLEEFDGEPGTVYVPAGEGSPLCDLWNASRIAIEEQDGKACEDDAPTAEEEAFLNEWSVMQDDSEPMEEPEPESFEPVSGNPIDVMNARGMAGDTFPLLGGDDYSKAKRPAVPSWKSLLTDSDDITEHGDAPVKGFSPADGWMILDLDEPKGADQGKPDGRILLESCTDGLGDPAIVVATPTGGLHAYYRIPSALRADETPWREILRNAAHPMAGREAYEDGPTYQAGIPVDVRVGRAGYAVLPGSTLPDGRGWHIVSTGSVDGSHELPRDIARRLRQWGFISDKATDWAGGMPKRDTVRATVSAGNPFSGLANGLPDMMPIPEGQRNDVLHAWCYGRHVNHSDNCAAIDRETYERGTASGLDRKEITSIIASVHRAI